ncbi:PAS domain-containing protein [Phormidium sp. LEGE 05292]|uniref:histidine kinase dimerization/phosphoacceptor domain -containing protein n=1 Tax=[Phormidium] sp. LEGE 05292 TaxID=767427 RepID=UPI00187E11F0|nr:histidine kinase dimerization/phosphoacceptor domain -containing protein [Phormidium sp. LEGE 05292]MBE9228804.1 PAS domain-containing protein [Phormidium sp. LEGE 05292]
MNGIEVSGEKFEVLYRIPIGICVLREDFVVIYWNRCLEKWTDILKQEIIGTNITTYFPHLGEPKYASRLQPIFAGGPPTIFSSLFHKHLITAYLPNGQLRVEHTTVTAEPAPDGSYYALLSIQDVTDLTQRVQDYRIMRDKALAEVQERQQAEAALQQTNDQLQAVLDAVPGLVSWISSDLKYIGVNHHLCATFNQPAESFIGKELGFLESSFDFANFMSSFMGSSQTAAHEVIDAKIKGNVKNYLIAAQKYQQGQAAVTVGIDITEQKQAEQELKASLQEKDVLLKEIHHRVKNNLQLISSLLKLQSEYIKDAEVISLLNDSYNRVRSMALIHEKLYQSQGIAQIDAADYIRSLAFNLIASHTQMSERIDFDIQVEPIFFDVDTAIPCGLIINELICNSLKYAFPNQSIGKITIKLVVRKNQFIMLEVADNGIGLPPGFNIETSESLGFQLVNNLTNQLDGNIAIDSLYGTFFRITFPLKSTIYQVPNSV